MASSSLPLSLLAKGIGQVVTNGHEKLEVYLEPEDYYNLKSHSPYHVAALQHQGRLRHGDIVQDYVKPIPLHKTFVTRKGALLIFSEELANKAIAEEVQRLELKQTVKQKEKQWEESSETASEIIASDKGPDSLRTVNDLSLAILTYGNKPDYRRKGEDLYLRFIHESRAPKTERKIRPGFSPKRYIATWSKYWDDGMLQKLRSSGLVSDKTLYRQNPLLPHLYQPASYNLSSMPVPYRVTRNMLLAPGNVGTYDFHRTRPGEVATRRGYDNEAEVAAVRKLKKRVRRDPPPSHEDSGELGGQVLREPIPVGSIQAVKFLETGEIQEVKYSELKPQEKQEILAELLATAWEHGKHIEETLDLVLSSNRPRARSGASSSAASELMVDMHRAILSLVESPVRKQIQERQRLLQLEDEKKRKRQEHEEAKKERKMLRKQQKMEKEAEKFAKQSKAREDEEQRKIKEKKLAEEHAKEKMQQETTAAEELADIERREKEDRRREKLEERERRRQARRDAKRKKEELRQAANEEEEEQRIRLQHEEDERRRRLKDEEADAREERRRQRQEKKQRKEEERARAEEERRKRHEEKAEQRRRYKKEKELQASVIQEDNEQIVTERTQHIVATVPAPPDETSSSTGQQRAVVLQGSAPMPQVPNNTPATEQRMARIQRQIPLENVIAEAQTKVSYTESASIVSSGSSKKSIPPGTLIAAGDGKFARVILGDVKTHRVKRHSKPLVEQPLAPIAPHSPRSHASEHSSGPHSNVFPAELPGDVASQRRSSFYGGAMPITSNIVKQTLSDKVSILSASQETTGSAKYDNSGHPSAPQDVFDDYNEGHYEVPVIGIEPPTPMQHNLFTTPVAKGDFPTMIPDGNYLSPAASESTKSKKSLRKLSRKSSYEDYDIEQDEKDDIESLHSSKSKTLAKADEQSSSIADSKSSKTKSDTYSSGKSHESSSKWLKADSAKFAGGNVESTYQTLKGAKGPGSQSSAATFSKTSSSKKSSSVRGSLPSSMRSQGKAVVFMPDGEILNVGGKIESLTDESSADESTEKVDVSRTEKSESPKPVLKKPSLKSASLASEPETQPSRKVSFKDDKEKTETTTEEEEEDESEWEESEKEVANWPQVAEKDVDSRPVSSRSEKLTQHAQKIAKIVVQTQRPDSRLEEDAAEGAKLWNQLTEEKSGGETEEDEEESETEEDSEEESTEDQEDVFKAALVEQEKKEKLEKEQKEKEKQERLAKVAEEKKKAAAAKEITARAPPKKVGPSSVKSFKSTSSVKSSISSIQETFVKEVQRKASELGVKESDLIFDADVVEKVSTSSIDPNEVQVVHDKEAGQHIVRSRHSSVTVSSYHTSASDSSTKETDQKKKLVIDMPIPEKLPPKSVSPRRSVSTVTSATASPTSPTRFQTPLSRSSSVTSKRKFSIPVDTTGVELDYELTSYEGKLGDPKPEEPLILSGRPRVEPEKIKDVGKAAAEKEQSKDKKKERKVKDNKDEAGKMTAEAGKKPEEKLNAESKAETVIQISEEEKLKRDLAKLTEGQKKMTKKAETKKSKRKKAVAVAEEQLQTRSPEKLPVKTPETPFVTGRVREKNVPEEPHSSLSSHSSKLPVKDVKKSEKPKSKKEPKTLVEMENKLTKPKQKSKEEAKKQPTEETERVMKQHSPVPVESPKQVESPEEEKEESLPELPAPTPEDTYEFVRVEDSPVQSEPEPESKLAEEGKQEDAKSHTSEVTEQTEEGTEKTDGTEGDQKSAQEDDSEREAKIAAKREREAKRAAAADKRRLEVERKRKEKEEQLRREKEEQERQEQLKEEFEAERRRREGEVMRKREEAAKEKERERQEEELRKNREEQQRERERRLQEERKKKMEELQRKKKEEEARKAEIARIEAEEAEQRRKEEEEMLAQMAEEERIEYERQKMEEEERKRIEAEERRKREEEQARIVMEQARIQALILAKQQAALEEKLKFVREFLQEANGLDQTQNVNRAFSFSYFELLQLLGLEFKDIQ